MKNINSFSINKSNLAETALSRQYTVSGEKDAEFILQVFDTSDPVQFYDFKTKSFSRTFTSTSGLSVKMKNDSYNGSINFPANASGDTYTILLLTPPNKDTELTFASGKNSYSTTIVQVANTTLTFTPITASSSSYESMPTSVTSITTPILTSSITKQLDWDIENKDNDANGFGLRLIRQPIDTDWYFTTTDRVNNRLNDTIEAIFSTVDGGTSSTTAVTIDADYTEAGGGIITVGDYVFLDGDGSVTLGTTVAAVNVSGDAKDITLSAAASIIDDDSLEFIKATTELIVDDLTDIVTGMVITAASGLNAYLIGTPTITAINTSTNTLTLSLAQAFVDDITLTFQARGSSMIQKAIGANIDFSNWIASVTSATSAELTKTVRGDVGSSTITLNGTRGISGGNFVTITGLGVVNTASNFVITNRTNSGDATASEAAGEIIMTLDQSDGGITTGTKLYFTGSTKKVTIVNNIVINSHPSSNRTIYLNLDNFITVGVNTA